MSLPIFFFFFPSFLEQKIEREGRERPKERGSFPFIWPSLSLFRLGEKREPFLCRHLLLLLPLFPFSRWFSPCIALICDFSPSLSARDPPAVLVSRGPKGGHVSHGGGGLWRWDESWTGNAIDPLEHLKHFAVVFSSFIL